MSIQRRKRTGRTALTLFAAVALVSIAVPASADDAPVRPTQSGTILPYHEEFIRLVSEEIDIYLGRTEYRVEVNYVFTNTGADTEITMGFPNESDWIYGRSIRNFRAWVDGTEQEIYRKEYRVSQKPYGEGSAPDYFYECFDTRFAAGQTRRVRNEYSQEYVTDYNQTVNAAKYILSTGAYWRGTIESVVVRIHYGRPDVELRARSLFFDPEEVEGPPVRYNGLEISPDPTGTIEDGVEIVLTDVEPDFDIEISMPPPVILHAHASSELESSRYSYAPANVLDNDPSTSWVEGEDGPGIGASLSTLLSANTAGGKLEGSYEVAAIGMINGYAASESLYNANNRVKSVRVEYYDAAGGYQQHSFTWELDQTMEMQYYRFPEPRLMSNLTFTIEKVFPGNRYDDTCIAEVLVVPAPARPQQEATE